MKKKVISVLLATAMVTGLVAGCGSSGNDSNTGSGGEYDGVELTYWSMWNSNEPQGEVLQAAADAFQEETGATVNIEWRGRDISTVIAAALESEEQIDLFEEDYNRIANNYADYVADLTDMAEEAGYADSSYEIFNQKSNDWAGFLCSITEQPQVGGVYYNQDLFDEAGITEVPTTWDEFLTVCQTLKDNGIQPLALDSAYAMFLFGYHLDRWIGEDAISELATNGGWSQNAGAVSAAQDMVDFVKAGYLADGAPDEYPASQDAIGLDGDVAMVVCANYVTAEVNAHSGTEVNWGVFNYPSVDGGADPTGMYAGANSIAITNYSENQQAAFDFAMFLTTGEYDQQMADTANQMPADPNNTVPDSQNGTNELLSSIEGDPLTWNMGLNSNADLQSSIQDVVIRMFEGQYNSGEEVTAALDALY